MDNFIFKNNYYICTMNKIEMHTGVQFEGNSSMGGNKSKKGNSNIPKVEKEESELVY